MTNKETITRKIGLTFGFVQHLIDNPKEIDSLPDSFSLNFVESDFTTVSNESPRRSRKKEKVVLVRNAFELVNK